MHIILITFATLVLLAACGPSAEQGIIEPAAEGSQTYLTGQQIYIAQCGTCHGFEGEGQFPEAPMQPDETGRIGAPPHDSSGHTWHHDDTLLVRIVKEGGMGDPAAFYPMPAFGDQLSDEEIRTVLAYIKTMWGPREVTVQRERTLAAQQQ